MLGLYVIVMMWVDSVVAPVNLGRLLSLGTSELCSSAGVGDAAVVILAGLEQAQFRPWVSRSVIVSADISLSGLCYEWYGSWKILKRSGQHSELGIDT